MFNGIRILDSHKKCIRTNQWISSLIALVRRPFPASPRRWCFYRSTLVSLFTLQMCLYSSIKIEGLISTFNQAKSFNKILNKFSTPQHQWEDKGSVGIIRKNRIYFQSIHLKIWLDIVLFEIFDSGVNSSTVDIQNSRVDASHFTLLKCRFLQGLHCVCSEIEMCIMSRIISFSLIFESFIGNLVIPWLFSIFPIGAPLPPPIFSHITTHVPLGAFVFGYKSPGCSHYRNCIRQTVQPVYMR